MYKGILLDLDNTLYEYEPLHTIAYNKQVEYLESNFSLSKLEINKAFEQAKQRVKNNLIGTAASHNRLLYAQVCCEILSINPLELSLKLYNIYWDTFLEHLSLSEGAIKMLNKHAHLPICLITDLTAHIQHRKINRLKLSQWVDHVVTSEEAGHEKPHPYIFQLALKKLNLSPSEVCMIGDNYDKDAQGAKSLGIHAYVLTDKQTAEEGITAVSNLGDIKW